MVKVTGLKSTFNGLGALYIPHADALRNMYGYVNYEGFNIECVPQNRLGDAIKSFSRGNIQNQNVVNRIVSVTKSTNRSSFLYAPNSEKLYLISIQKFQGEFNAQMTVFGLPNRLPVGAFATSAG